MTTLLLSLLVGGAWGYFVVSQGGPFWLAAVGGFAIGVTISVLL